MHDFLTSRNGGMMFHQQLLGNHLDVLPHQLKMSNFTRTQAQRNGRTVCSQSVQTNGWFLLPKTLLETMSAIG